MPLLFHLISDSLPTDSNTCQDVATIGTETLPILPFLHLNSTLHPHTNGINQFTFDSNFALQKANKHFKKTFITTTIMYNIESLVTHQVDCLTSSEAQNPAPLAKKRIREQLSHMHIY